ncbi:MAG: hypothetical protein MZV49_18265 [Rhodopseudomonas palustris]|nr:hypothetical protein [Rhodopseudomonas palustris]
MTDPNNPLAIDTRDPAEYQAALGVYRFEKLKQQIRHVWSNTDYFQPRLIAAGLSSPDDIRSLDDFRRLPAMLDKASHRQSREDSLARYGHPFGLHLTVPIEQAVHLAATSGTTGQPTFYVFSPRDLEISHRVLGKGCSRAAFDPAKPRFTPSACRCGWRGSPMFRPWKPMARGRSRSARKPACRRFCATSNSPGRPRCSRRRRW